MKTFQFNIGDWVTSTRHLSRSERGALLELIERYYVTEKPLTRDYIDRIKKPYSSEERQAVEFVLGEFFTEEDGVFRNARCDAEIAKYKGQSHGRVGRSQAGNNDAS